MQMQKITVLVAVGNPVLQAGLCSLLQEDPGLDIISRLGDSQQAIIVTKQLIPKVVIIDAGLPKTGGMKVCEQIKAACPTTAIIVLCMQPCESEMFTFIRAGAAGYLSLNTAPRELLSAIYSICSGEAVIDLETIRKTFEHIGASKDRTEALGLLHSREVEILKLAADGFSNKRIATRLGISERTVQSHMVHIFAKLQVGSRTEAVVKGLQEGWLTLTT